MKLSLKWLNDHVDVNEFFKTPDVLADKLTDAGLEVEEVENLSEAFKHVVVGKITTLGKHPDADKLTYCDVNVGNETLKIVCGAKNHKQGDKVCVAKVGAILPGDFKIKKSKIRGVESFGMLCSTKELGLGAESDGIMIFPTEAPIGEDFATYYGLDDVFYEINVTPNRADCLSHLGLAREVSTLFKKPLKSTEAREGVKTVQGKSSIKINLKNSDLCPRYTGKMIYNVKVKPSPEWLVKRLEAVGLNSINNIVDVTNYVMLDSGQPLHAFDSDVLKGGEVIIEKATPGETFKSLDETEFKLSGEELTIRDSSGPLALAGVVGGVNSGVTEKTTNIFLESAHFIPSIVRKTSRALGIDTDSSYRFSRGTDVSRVKTCLDEAANLIAELSGGEVGEETQEAYPKKKETPVIKITKEYIEERLGFPVASSVIENCFKSLGFEFKEENDSWDVKSNDYRWDIQIREDLVEEVGRLIGYDNIPEIIPAFSDVPQNENSQYNNFNKIREQFKGFGFYEVIHYNFYSGAQEVKWSEEVGKIFNMTDDVHIKNPLSSDLSVMRSSCAPQFVSNFIRNWRLGSQEGKIFEIGKAHGKYKEAFMESSLLTGACWGEDSSEKLLKDMLGYLESFMVSWGVSNFRIDELKDKVSPDFLHPKFTASIVAEGKPLGFIYSLSPAFSKENKVAAGYVGFEMNLDQFLKGKPRPKKYKEFSRYPVVQRDFSVTVDKNYDFLSFKKIIKKSAPGIFRNLKVHDEYEGDKIPEGKVSLTLRAEFQSKEKTLTDEDLKKLQKEVMKELGKI